eukprot:maker-scaffold48_size466083-snap-gene-1.25 protein:Tk05974 transcript:maker-scaffold48_size466083-snap-gene-1.25-mRNA-1 annotation:"protein isoform a-like"
MVATKDIDIGTILFKEAPLAVGPFKDRSLTVLCLGCYLPLRNQKFRCSKCHIPLCSKACETRSEHARECNHFRTKPDLISQTEPFSNWDCIFPLRILLLKDQYPDKYQLIQDLVTNRRLKESSPDWKGLLECCDTLTDQFQLDIDREEVLDILCALDSNSYQVLSKGVFETMSGIYPRASMLNHSCISNTRPIIVSDYGMKVVTTAKIARDSYVIEFTLNKSRSNSTTIKQPHQRLEGHNLDPSQFSPDFIMGRVRDFVADLAKSGMTQNDHGSCSWDLYRHHEPNHQDHGIFQAGQIHQRPNGPCHTQKDEDTRKFVAEDKRVTVREIPDKLGLSIGTIDRIVILAL